MTGIIVGALAWAARLASSPEDARAFDEAAEEVEPVEYGIEQPFNSNNPVKVFLHGIQRLAAKILRTRGVRNKLRVLGEAAELECGVGGLGPDGPTVRFSSTLPNGDIDGMRIQVS